MTVYIFDSKNFCVVDYLISSSDKSYVSTEKILSKQCQNNITLTKTLVF